MTLSPALTRFGKVEAIEERHQPKKVWKHFHDPAEHWERLAGQDLTGLRLEAEELVGVLRSAQLELPDLPGQRKLRAHEALRRHHDDYYGSIYLTELSSHETRWAETIDRRHRTRSVPCALADRYDHEELTAGCAGFAGREPRHDSHAPCSQVGVSIARARRTTARSASAMPGRSSMPCARPLLA